MGISFLPPSYWEQVFHFLHQHRCSALAEYSCFLLHYYLLLTQQQQEGCHFVCYIGHGNMLEYL